jgi:predicted DCC family thiol-disulfide oxidoreductase YuxK
VRFLLHIDSSSLLYFAALQGNTADVLRSRVPEIPASIDTIIYVEDFGTRDEAVFYASDAVLRIMNRIGGYWRFLHYLSFIPRVIRDGIYRFIAGNRYRWFGKYRECPLPPPEIRDRFLS